MAAQFGEFEKEHQKAQENIRLDDFFKKEEPLGGEEKRALSSELERRKMALTRKLEAAREEAKRTGKELKGVEGAEIVEVDTFSLSDKELGLYRLYSRLENEELAKTKGPEELIKDYASFEGLVKAYRDYLRENHIEDESRKQLLAWLINRAMWLQVNCIRRSKIKPSW